MFDEYFAYFGLTGGVLLIIGIGLLIFLLVLAFAAFRMLNRWEKERG